MGVERECSLRACVRACMRACVRACVRVCMCEEGVGGYDVVFM